MATHEGDVQNIKKYVVESIEVVNAKPSQDKGKVVAQIDNHEEKKGEEIPQKFPKLGLNLLAILLITKEK